MTLEILYKKEFTTFLAVYGRYVIGFVIPRSLIGESFNFWLARSRDLELLETPEKHFSLPADMQQSLYLWSVAKLNSIHRVSPASQVTPKNNFLLDSRFEGESNSANEPCFSTIS